MPKQSETITGGRAVGKSEMEQGVTRGADYDPKNFYIRSVDNNHNRDTTRVDSMKCPPYLNARVMKWVNDPRTPYATAADFWRDAGAHRVQFLEQLDQDETYDWGFLGMAEKRERLSREALDMNQQAEAFQRDINQAILQGDTVWFSELIELGKSAVEHFREPYRTRILLTIQPHLDGKVDIITRRSS